MPPNSEKPKAIDLPKNQSFGALMHVYDQDDKGEHNQISKDAVQAVQTNVKQLFPKALNAHVLAFQLGDTLSHFGFTNHNTLLATCFCCDDANRDLEAELVQVFESHHALTGLAGFCFGGSAAVADMLHHIPLNGHGLIVYGPHIGIDWDGRLGKVNRRGHPHGSGISCGPAHAAAASSSIQKDDFDPNKPVDCILNAQQRILEKQLYPYKDRIAAKAGDDCQAALELQHVLYECQTKVVNDILDQTLSQLQSNQKLAVVGGIQVNTPEGTAEYFLPLRYQVYSMDGEPVVDHLQELHNSIVNTAGW